MKTEDITKDVIVKAYYDTGLGPVHGYVYANGKGCALGALLFRFHGIEDLDKQYGIETAMAGLGMTSRAAWAIGDGFDKGFRDSEEGNPGYYEEELNRLWDEAYAAGKEMKNASY